MDLQTVMQELEALGKERTKKMYISNGAHEPLFGAATGAMKPIAKKSKEISLWQRNYTVQGTMMPCTLQASSQIQKP